MEKNRIRPVTSGKSMRMSYSRQKEVLQMPNLIEVQKDSYQWFLDEGLKEAFADISPITDYSGKLSLDFVIIQNSKKAHENNNIHIIMNLCEFTNFICYKLCTK